MTGAGSPSGGLTPGEWLSARTPRPPGHLARRLELVASEAQAGAPIDEQLARLAVRRLGDLVEAGDHSRAIAGELLAVDALVTYACEAAAERWRSGQLTDSELTEWCRELAARVAGVAGTSR